MDDARAGKGTRTQTEWKFARAVRAKRRARRVSGAFGTEVAEVAEVVEVADVADVAFALALLVGRRRRVLLAPVTLRVSQFTVMQREFSVA